MGHLPKLIEDLALILMAGAITTLLFRKIKQPLVLGYIIAGFLVGPHFHLTPSVADSANIKTLAEIGVIFLLFSLGLEFSFKKLMRVGGAASITAFVEIIFITAAGYFTGKLLGWTTMDSLFMGGMLASSSTTIIIRAFDELGVKTKQYARIVFGVLVVEDIVVILLMVLLSTMAVTKQFEGGEMLFTILKLLFFLALWFITGIFLLPTFLKKAKKLLDDETLLILSLGLCLGMVVLATQVGFSAELGAFIMGSVIAETTSAEKVEHLIKPVKDLFGAVFFVSVGMMIDPQAIIKYGGPVIIITLLTLFGKLLSTTAGAIISGQPLKQAVQVGMSMAQIGEFAFIVATLGLSLGVISDFLFPIAVGASAITTFTTPYLIKYSEPFYNFLLKILPARWVKTLNNYSTGTQQIQAESKWKKVLKSYAVIGITNGIVIISIILLSLKFLDPFLKERIADNMLRSIVVLVLSVGTAAPFLWAMMVKKPTILAYKELWLDKKYNHGPLVVLEFLRIIIGILLIGLWVDWLFSAHIAILVVLPIILLSFFLFSKSIQHFYNRIEGRFITNLNARESLATSTKTISIEAMNKPSEQELPLAPWDAHIIDVEVSQHAQFAGKPLVDLAWREKYGINIVYIKRGLEFIHTPGRNNILLPFDHVGIMATDEQMQLLKPEWDTTLQSGSSDLNPEDISLQKLVVDEFNQLKGQSIRSSGIRDFTNGLVVGIERKGLRLLNPHSESVFEWGDIVWIVGERKKINKMASGGLRKKEEIDKKNKN